MPILLKDMNSLHYFQNFPIAAPESVNVLRKKKRPRLTFFSENPVIFIKNVVNRQKTVSPLCVGYVFFILRKLRQKFQNHTGNSHSNTFSIGTSHF